MRLHMIALALGLLALNWSPVGTAEAAEAVEGANAAAASGDDYGELPGLPIEGLSLPEAAVFKGTVEMREELQATQERRIDELLVLDFDCDCGWPEVVREIGEQLIAAGFIDEFAEREGEQEYLLEHGPTLMDMSALMRSYSNPETGQWVALQNITARFDKEHPERAKLDDGRTILRWKVMENELEEGESMYQLQIMSFE